MSVDFTAADGIVLITLDRTVPPDQLPDKAFRTARRIAAIREGLNLKAGLRMEQIANRFFWATEDVCEGPAAFAERRQPNFKGR